MYECIQAERYRSVNGSKPLWTNVGHSSLNFSSTSARSVSGLKGASFVPRRRLERLMRSLTEVVGRGLLVLMPQPVQLWINASLRAFCSATHRSQVKRCRQRSWN